MPFSTYMQSEIGHAEIEPCGELEAGSYVALQLTYTAGHFGIDDTGAIKISWRTASDAAKPQFSEPRGADYSTAFASNGATLAIEVNRNNLRPWVNTLLIRVARGFLRAGDRIVVTLGDRSQGAPGYPPADRLRARVLFQDLRRRVLDLRLRRAAAIAQDPAGARAGRPLEGDPADAPARGRAVPARAGGRGPLGQPDRARRGPPHLRADRPVEGLPEPVSVRGGRRPGRDRRAAGREPGRSAHRAARCGRRAAGTLQPACGSSPTRRSCPIGAICTARATRPSAPTARPTTSPSRATRPSSTSSATRATTFRSTTAFWAEINRLAREYDRPGEMVALPGYEWSGNTGMGGDRNVFFHERGAPDPPLVERPARARRRQRRPHGGRAVRGAGRRGRGGDRPCRRALRRPRGRPRRPPRARGRGPFLLGHLRVALARRLPARPPGRPRLPQRRPQGAPGRRLSRRLDLRRDRRADLLSDAAARSCRRCSDPAPAPLLRHHRHAPASRRPGALCRRRRAVRGRSRSSAGPPARRSSRR